MDFPKLQSDPPFMSQPSTVDEFHSWFISSSSPIDNSSVTSRHSLLSNIINDNLFQLHNIDSQTEILICCIISRQKMTHRRYTNFFSFSLFFTSRRIKVKAIIFKWSWKLKHTTEKERKKWRRRKNVNRQSAKENLRVIHFDVAIKKEKIPLLCESKSWCMIAEEKPVYSIK